MSRKSQRNRPSPTTPPEKAPASGSGRMVAIVLAVLVAGGIGWALYQGTLDPAPQSSEGGSPLASEHAPTLGDPEAKVHIVEFIDPACETCAVFYPAVKQLMAANPGRIRLSLRHLPFHDGSEFAVRVLEASRAQDKYWETLETLLATQPRWAVNHVVRPELVMQAIAPLGLDTTQLRADMQSPEVTERMQRDIADATALKVRATPEYYVNGQPLPSFGWEQLQALVRSELQAAY